MAKKKDDFDVERCSARLKAVSDSDRLRLIYQLRDGRKNVSTLADAIGAEIVNVSHHLGVLRAAKVVNSEKVGRFVYYTLNPDLMEQHGHSLTFQLHGARLIIN
jgi:ArsR family transcriptional regulator